MGLNWWFPLLQYFSGVVLHRRPPGVTKRCLCRVRTSDSSQVFNVIYLFPELYIVGMDQKKISNDQELMQSNPLPHPQKQKRAKHKHTKLKTFTTDTHEKPNEQLPPRQMATQLSNLKQQQHPLLPIFRFKLQNRTNRKHNGHLSFS